MNVFVSSSKLETVLQSEIVGVKSLIMGIKGENYMVERVRFLLVRQQISFP